MFSDPAVQQLLVRCALLLLGLAATVLGLWLTLRVRWHERRSGSSPHCAHCGYNLTGLPLRSADLRCPECGAELLVPRALVRGRPFRRRDLIVAVASLMVIGGAAITVTLTMGVYRNTRWTRVKPSSWLLQDARAGGVTTAMDARYTLARRLDRGALSPEQAGAFIEHLLQVRAHPRHRQRSRVEEYLDHCFTSGQLSPKQAERYIEYLLQLEARPELSSAERNTLRRLSAWHDQGRLSDAQTKRFLENALAIRLDTYSSIPLDTPIAVRLQTEGRIDVSHCATHAQVVSITCDGDEAVAGLDPVFAAGSFTGVIKHTMSLAPRPLGKHTVRVVVWAGVHPYDPQTRQFAVEPIHEMTREVQAEFEVVAKPAKDLIRLRPDPALTDVLRSKLTLERAFACISIDQETGARCADVRLTVRAQNGMPIGVAYEVIGEFERRSFSLGYLTFRAGDPPDHLFHYPTGRLFNTVPCALRVRLVASAEAALTTVDLDEIWEGEIDLGTIPVENAERANRWLKKTQDDK